MKILKREEIPEKYKWKLEDLFEDESKWEEARKEAQGLLESMRTNIRGIVTTASNLLTFLKQSKEVDFILEKVFVYAHLKHDENTKDSKGQELGQKLTSLQLLYSDVSSSFHTEFLTLDGAKVETYYHEEPSLLFYKKYFDEILRAKPHTLSKEQEYILSQTSLLDSSDDIYGMLSDADLSFPKIKDEEGNEVEITQGNFIQYMQSKDREVRKSAFKALYSSFKKFENTFASTLYASNKTDRFHATIRNHPSSLEASLFSDNISPEVYTNLIETVKQNIEPMEKYIKLRKKLLNVEELHMYDIYAPLIKDMDVEISYEEAYETMKKALGVLGEDYVGTVSDAYTEGWIDVYENEGKRSGAYKSGAYGVHPYILLNHKDNLESMFTLVHEMGHAMHSYYSNKHNPQVYAHYKIFVAEVASTVNEVLLMRYLLKNTNDKKMKMYLINYFLEQFRTTVYRQTMFAEFEKITHDRVEKDEPLTADALRTLYYNLNKEYYGEEIVHDQEIAVEWARIPHFYSAFYVYKYATGFSAAMALSKQILEEGESAVNRYLDFLKSGGTDFPIELLKRAGVDMTTPQPIEDALNVFGELVDELEELI
ncbi:oligoendopeptidase F [Oceanobacillus bengalensis]|uniref:Oligopeptidase F n=1 Tax=Oceanobacillus bengalensis TaxID=1435466 RepID=A0A494YRG6_9BACI|nr:oligoendopeptidase F [Oceanobacillus bengalensis]RKQ11840.1 oligoendopeptidase F [Oceanobacillus bengalensis]